MSEEEKPGSARERLWAKETAVSWNISTRVLLIVGVKGSFFDPRNPRLPLFKKLESVIEDKELQKLETVSRKAKNAKELRELAARYNERYLSLFLERFDEKELRQLSVASDGEVKPSRELEESTRH